MLIQTTLTTVIESVVGSRLTEVALDGRNALLQQTENLRLVPRYCFGIGEIENRIFHWHTARGIHHMESFLDDLWEEAVLRREIRQLPQTSMEAIVSQLLQHLHRVLETVLRELIVALPIHIEPPSIEMNHVGRNTMVAQLFGNLQSFLLREISNTTHPGTKAPEWKHRTLSCYVGIFIQNLFRLTKEKEEVDLLISHEQALCTDIALTEVTGDRCRGMHEHPIAPIREIERNRLILTVTFGSLRIGNRKMHLLSYLIKRGERLAAAIDTLIGSKREHRVYAPTVIRSPFNE